LKDQVLDAEKRRVLALQSELANTESFFLAGGTGLGLRLGHRSSRDLDWFTPRAFDAKQLAAKLAALPQKPTELQPQGAHTLRAYYGMLETSFLRYTQVPARAEPLKVAGVQIQIADIQTFAVMKAAAVHDRGTKRDFVDIHAITKLPGWSIPRFIELATNQLPLQGFQMKLALTYFADAEKDDMPPGCTIAWKTVKADLQQGVREWERSRSRGMDR
jgi:hypothetical protein